MPRRIILSLPFLILSAVPAHALEVGHCDTPEKLSAKVEAEGHKIVAMMDRAGVSPDKGGRHDIAQIVTATPDLDRWYVVNGDEPLSKRSSRMCVVIAGKNLEINDHRRDGPPTVTRYRFDRDKALADCERLDREVRRKKGYGIRCNEYNYAVRLFADDPEFYERMALQGISDDKTLVTFVADPRGTENDGPMGPNDYTMFVTTPAGATTISARGIRFSFSNWIRTALNKRQASRD